MESVRDAGGAGAADHPRTLGWVAATALAMGGSNQSLFLITALFAGQGDIPGQGSAAVPLLIIGLLLAWAAAPGWTELVLMYPEAGRRDRGDLRGGLSSLQPGTGQPHRRLLLVGLGADLRPDRDLFGRGDPRMVSARRTRSPPSRARWFCSSPAVNLCGVKWAGRLAIPIATASGLLALVSALAPIAAGEVDWQQATSFHLTVPFEGWFGELTGFMAGLYLIGFAAPAFEAAVCHVGEMINPNRNVPRAMFASAAMASIYFIVLPVVWLGVLGPEQLGKDLMLVLGPTFAPMFGSFAKAAAIWFMMFNMFHGTLQPLAGATRTISQLAEDGLLPRTLMKTVAHRRAVGVDLPHGRHGHFLPAAWRSDLARCGRQFHVSHRDLSAQCGGVAAATQPAGSAASLSCTARDDRRWGWRRPRSGPFPRCSASSSSG